MSCCGEKRRQASQMAVAVESVRPRSSDIRRGLSELRITRFEPFSVPLICWAVGAVALVMWGWSFSAVISVLFR